MIKEDIAPFLKNALKVKSTFNYFWHLPKNWFEPPNYRRGGWSGVITHQLPQTATSDAQSLFVKLQSKSVFKTIKRPFRGLPTFYREYVNTQRAKAAGVSVLEFVYYGQRDLNAILVSKSLEGYLEFNKALLLCSDDPVIKKKLVNLLADNLIKIHGAYISHGALNQKHILVKFSNTSIIDLCIIDFEKSRKIFRNRGIVIDLHLLFKTTDLNEDDKNFIFSQYSVLFTEKKILTLKKQVAQRTARKEIRHQKKYANNVL